MSTRFSWRLPVHVQSNSMSETFLPSLPKRRCLRRRRQQRWRTTSSSRLSLTIVGSPFFEHRCGPPCPAFFKICQNSDFYLLGADMALRGQCRSGCAAACGRPWDCAALPSAQGCAVARTTVDGVRSTRGSMVRRWTAVQCRLTALYVPSLVSNIVLRACHDTTVPRRAHHAESLLLALPLELGNIEFVVAFYI